MMMLFSVLILNLLIEVSFSQSDSCFLVNEQCGTTKMLLSTSLYFENFLHEMINALFQTQATVKIQIDELDDSAVINLIRAADSNVIALISDFKLSEYLSSSLMKSVALIDQSISYSINCFTIFISSTEYVVSTFLSQTANFSQFFNISALYSSSLTSIKSANVSVFMNFQVSFSQDLLNSVLIFDLMQLIITFLL